MDLSNIGSASINKTRKRIGRGNGSGHGKTSCKGHKGQNSRSGGGTRPGFEGGQMPLLRKIPKRGFKNAAFKIEYAVVNLGQLILFDANEVVNLSSCIKKGLVAGSARRLKVLSNGNITRALTIRADKFSKAAAEKILAANGKIEEVRV